MPRLVLTRKELTEVGGTPRFPRPLLALRVALGFYRVRRFLYGRLRKAGFDFKKPITWYYDPGGHSYVYEQGEGADERSP